jgi:hypothetical protein
MEFHSTPHLKGSTQPSIPPAGFVSLDPATFMAQPGLVLPDLILPNGARIPLGDTGGVNAPMVSKINQGGTGTNAASTFGITISASGTLSRVSTIASADRWQRRRRIRTTTTAASNQTAGLRTAYVEYLRGSVLGQHGFLAQMLVGHGANTAGHRAFAGFTATTGVLAIEPTAMTDCFGVGYESADLATGNWQLIRNDNVAAGTKVDTGIPRSVLGLDIRIYAPAGDTSMSVAILNASTGALGYEAQFTTDLPRNTIPMALKMEVNTSASTTAAQCDIGDANILQFTG